MRPKENAHAYSILGFLNIKNELRSTLKVLQTANWESITYNIKKGAVTLRGDEIAVRNAGIKLQSTMQEHNKQALYLCWLRQLAATQHAIPPNSRGRLQGIIPIEENNTSSPRSRFVIREKEDKELLKLWMNILLPSLPTILDDFLGPKYTANLLRHGTVRYSQPTIEVRCAFVPGKEAQEYIEERVGSIFDASGHGRIPLRFFRSSSKLLANTSSKEENRREHDKNHAKFSFTRPWNTPGMGASIGLLCSSRVSATLGGYVLVDGEKFMLTTDHFITKSLEIDNDASEHPRVTSPSSSDLIHMQACLAHNYKEGRANLKMFLRNKFGDGDISLIDMGMPDSQYQIAVNSNALTANILDAVEAPKEDFVIGRVHRRCVENRKAIIPGRPDPVLYKMDWCLSEVNDHAGENRHRYQSNDDAIADNYSPENTEAPPSGLLCEEACAPKANAKVHYVGQQSCHRSGEVNAALLLDSDVDGKVHAWTILCSTPISSSEQVEGDSGAWIIQSNTDKVMGQVYGFNGGDITFTPIHDIFADIKDALEAEEVNLPRSQNHQNPPAHTTTSQTTYTCKVEPDKPRQCQAYEFLKPRSILVKPKPLKHIENPYLLPCIPPAFPWLDTKKANPGLFQQPLLLSPSFLASVVPLARVRSRISTTPRLSGEVYFPKSSSPKFQPQLLSDDALVISAENGEEQWQDPPPSSISKSDLLESDLPGFEKTKNNQSKKSSNHILRTTKISQESDYFRMDSWGMNPQIRLGQGNLNRPNRLKYSSIQMGSRKAMSLQTSVVQKWDWRSMRYCVKLKRKSNTFPQFEQQFEQVNYLKHHVVV